MSDYERAVQRLTLDNGSDAVGSISAASNSRRRTNVKCRILRKMLARLFPNSREFLVIVFISFAAASLLGGTRLRTQKAPEAGPFFREASLVHDFPNGNLQSAFNAAADSVFTLVCYYAPWDSGSQAIRRELDEVARVFYDRVMFLAVNCWNPEGTCRGHFPKIPYYPILVVYVRNYKGIVYRGPLKAGYIGRFVAEVTKRVIRINSAEEAAAVLKTKDAIVIGHFDIKGPAVDPQLPRAYLLFYSLALKALEYDPVGDVAFGVVVNPSVAFELGLKEPGIAVHTWLQYEVYPDFANFTQSAEVGTALDWIFRTAMRSVEWITLRGGSPQRGQALSKFIADGPTLVLFTPRNPWLAVSPFYQLLLQASAEYLNCEGEEGVAAFSAKLAAVRRRYPEDLRRWEEECSSVSSGRVSDGPFPTPSPCVLCPSWPMLRGDSVGCCNCYAPDAGLVCDVCVSGTFSCSLLPLVASKQFIPVEHDGGVSCWENAGAKATTSYCCWRWPAGHEHWRNVANGSSTAENDFRLGKVVLSSPDVEFHTGPVEDDRVASAVRQERELRCRMLSAAAKLDPTPWAFPGADLPFGGRMDAIRGLRCLVRRDESLPLSPRPLNFVAIDSRLHPEFGRKLGFEVVDGRYDTFAVIIDLHEESHYLMDRPVSEATLVDFVRNYTAGSLARCKFEAKKVEMPEEAAANCSGSCFRVEDITAKNFDDVIVHRRQDVVLFFHAPWCGFCAAASHVFLSVAKLFADFTADVKFVRVDGDANTLPWEYDMPSFPTVLYLPNDRAKDSRVFPLEKMPLDAENLLKFVLANASVRTRWKFALTDCDSDCAARLRAGVRARIRSLLARYRAALRDGIRSRPELRSVMARLQHYRGMYWAFTDPDVVFRD